MPKLSDTFLQLLGNSLQGEEGSPAGRERRSIALSENARAQQLADLSQRVQQAQNARANIDTQAGLAGSFNPVAPGTPTVNPAGSFQIDPNSASLTGLTPGTTYQPLPKSADVATVNPNYGKPGFTGSPISAPQHFDIPRGGSFSVSQAPLQLLGQQATASRDIYDRADTDVNTLNSQINAVSTATFPKGIGEAVTTSILSGAGVPREFLESPQYQAGVAQLQSLQQQLQQAKVRRDAAAKGLGVAPAMSMPTGGAAPLMGHIRVKNIQTGQTGQIPQANFNPALYQQIP